MIAKGCCSDGSESTVGVSSVKLAQTRSDDTNLDLEQNISNELPLTAITDFLDDAFEISGNGIKCKFAGRVKVNFRIGRLTRTSIWYELYFTVYKNGASTDLKCQMSRYQASTTTTNIGCIIKNHSRSTKLIFINLLL